MEYKKVKQTPKFVKTKLAKRFIAGKEVTKAVVPLIDKDDFKEQKPKKYKHYKSFGEIMKKSRFSRDKKYDFHNDIDVNLKILRLEINKNLLKFNTKKF